MEIYEGISDDELYTLNQTYLNDIECEGIDRKAELGIKGLYLLSVGAWRGTEALHFLPGVKYVLGLFCLAAVVLTYKQLRECDSLL